MKLYQEIILLQHFFKGLYCIENVIGYYLPLIKPEISGRHYFWANFKIPNLNIKGQSIKGVTGFNAAQRIKQAGFEENYFNGKGVDVPKVIKNMVTPEIGLSILNAAMGIIEQNSVKTGQLF